MLPVRPLTVTPPVFGLEPPLRAADEWSALADRCGADPFLHPDWSLAWQAAFDPAGRTVVATVRDATGLRAAVPVLRTGGVLRLTVNEHVPWSAVLADSASVAEQLVAGVVGMRVPELRVTAARLDGELAASLRATVGPAGRVVEYPTRRSPYVDLADVTDVAQLLERGFAKDLRRRRRRLDELGTVELTRHVGGPDLAQRLDEAFAMEARQWKGTSGTAISARPETLAFYTSVATVAAARKELQLSVLRVDGHAVAMALDLLHDDVLYSLKTAYDPEFARFSPGQLLTHEVLAHAVGHGVARYELLGRDEPYKMRWTSSCHELGTVIVYAPTPAGRLAYVRRRYAEPAAARVRDRWVRPAVAAVRAAVRRSPEGDSPGQPS